MNSVTVVGYIFQNNIPVSQYHC